MLDIINGKVVAKTAEGCFEIEATNAHRAITVHFLELMEDNNPEHIRENYKAAVKLYKIGELIYKDESITKELVTEDLMPLMDCLVKDIAERHLAYMVMRYVTREYQYRIQVKHEEESLYNFFCLLRDPIFTTILKEKPDFELFYRIRLAFFDETNEKLIEDHCTEEINDREYIFNDQKAFREAVFDGSPLPVTDSNREYGKMVQGIVNMPLAVANWGMKFDENKIVYTGDFEDIKEYIQLHKIAYSPTACSNRHCVDQEYELEYCKKPDLKDAYARAKRIGCYNICYYIALRIGSDTMRKSIARLAGADLKVYSDHNSSRRTTKRILTTIGIIIALFIAYSALKWLYNFLYLPIIFWILVLSALGGFFSTPESRASAALLTTQSPYRRARLEQAMRQEKQLKELNENLQKYNYQLSKMNNGYRHF